MDKENENTLIIKRPTKCKHLRSAEWSNTLSTGRIRKRVKCVAPNCCNKAYPAMENTTNQIKPKISLLKCHSRTNLRDGVTPLISSKNELNILGSQEPINYTDEGICPLPSPILGTGHTILSQSLMELIELPAMTQVNAPESQPTNNSNSWSDKIINSVLTVPRISSSVKKMKECPICYKIFPSGVGKRNHLEIHEGRKPFVCPTCEFGFETDIMLLEHVSRHHWNDGAVFPCQLCEKSYKTHSGLTSHEAKMFNINKNECI